MTTLEKQELIRLLCVYQDELLSLNSDNLKRSKKYKAEKTGYYQREYHEGIKAQFERVRILVSNLSKDISKEVLSRFELY